jgi:hypothetical protein
MTWVKEKDKKRSIDTKGLDLKYLRKSSSRAFAFDFRSESEVNKKTFLSDEKLHIVELLCPFVSKDKNT